MTDQPPNPPAALNRFVRIVLSYKPKPKSKPAKARKRRAVKALKEARSHDFPGQQPDK
jgi:hypothetical protein